jgi:hypothetical protein
VTGLGVMTTESRTVTVADQAIRGLDFSLAVASLAGRILMDDGSAIPDPHLFADAIVSTVDNPNVQVSTVMPIAPDGTFSRLLEAGRYRFYMRSLPSEYTITSIMAGTQNLLKENLNVPPMESTSIEVRVMRMPGPAIPGRVKVTGIAIDSFTGLATMAERMTLCCFDSGPGERLSTPLGSDGLFEFASVPPGRYKPALQAAAGRPKVSLVDKQLDVRDLPLSGLTLLSTAQISELTATVVFENGNAVPATANMTVVFRGTPARVSVVAERNADVGYTASVPAGDRYTVSVTNLPAGYSVKSVSGPTEVPRSSTANSFSGIPPIPAPVVITLAPPLPETPR